MKLGMSLGLVLVMVLVGGLAVASRGDPVQDTDHPAPIVFVCRNGVAMSVWSAAYFNRLAAERGLRERAVSRASIPSYRDVPLHMRFALAVDGFRLHGYRPKVVDAADTQDAELVIMIDDAVLPPDAIVLNAGICPRLELVVEGRGLAPLDPGASERRYQIVDTGLTAKGLLRRGSLQGESGPSVAVEAGVLLPTLHDEGGVGGEAIGIVSQRFRHLTAHLNGEVAYTRSETWELGLGLILEGPAWRGVRPVVEATVAREVGEANLASGLAGVIWEARPGLSFDLAFRYARDDGTDTREVRAGLTWTFDATGGAGP